MTSFHNILVPVDFEPSSRQALDVALDFALRFDAKLTVVHAWDLPGYMYSPDGFPYGDVWTALEQAARAQLDEMLAAARKKLPRAEALLVRGRPADEVLAAASRLKADLIVIGTHGRHGVNRLLLGSVAEHVVRGATVPVLTVRAGAAA